MRVVAVAEHGDVDQARRSCILPGHGVEPREVGPLVEPAPDAIVTGVRNEARKAADVFVVGRIQPITLDHYHGAPLTLIREEPEKEPRRVVVAGHTSFTHRVDAPGRASSGQTISNTRAHSSIMVSQPGVTCTTTSS